MIGSITRSIVNYKYCSYCLVVMPRYTVHTGAEHFCRTEINDWLTVWLKVVLSTPFIIPSFMKFWHISKRQVRVSIRWSVTVAHTGSTSCVATPSTPTSSAALLRDITPKCVLEYTMHKNEPGSSTNGSRRLLEFCLGPFVRRQNNVPVGGLWAYCTFDWPRAAGACTTSTDVCLPSLSLAINQLP